MSPECRDLIDRLLALDPKARLGHRGAGEIKLHPWFEGVGWPSLSRSKAAFVPSLDGDTDTSYFSSKQARGRAGLGRRAAGRLRRRAAKGQRWGCGRAGGQGWCWPGTGRQRSHRCQQ